MPSSTVRFQVGDQVVHDKHGRGEIVWVYRVGLLVEFADEEFPRHIMEWELRPALKGGDRG
jgi:hypothetical protein